MQEETAANSEIRARWKKRGNAWIEGINNNKIWKGSYNDRGPKQDAKLRLEVYVYFVFILTVFYSSLII